MRTKSKQSRKKGNYLTCLIILKEVNNLKSMKRIYKKSKSHSKNNRQLNRHQRNKKQKRGPDNLYKFKISNRKIRMDIDLEMKMDK